MRVYPENAASKIGFGIVLGQIRAHLKTAEGREVLEVESPSSDQDEVARRLQQVADVQQILRFDDPLPWDDLEDVRPFMRSVRPAGSVPDPTDLIDLLRMIKAAGAIKRYVLDRRDKFPSLSGLGTSIADLHPVAARIESSVGVDGEVLDAASDGLARIRREISSREADLRSALMRELRKAISSGYATEDQPTIRNGRMVIPVRAEAKRKVKGFVQDASATGQTVFVEPAACLDLNNEVRELQAEERREVRRVLLAIGDELRPLIGDILTTSSAMAAFDVIQAKAKVANGFDGVIPALNDGTRLVIRRGLNPALAIHLSAFDDDGDRDVVPLDFEMAAERRTVLITGPNAGGKTVALGTIGLFAMMICRGIPVPAEEGTEMPVFRRLFLDIGDEQSIEDDLSTFSSHVRNLREMILGADQRTLVLIDEAGTGTDPEEGAVLAQAALESLHEAGAWTVATTHHGRLKAFAHDAPFARNAAMEFDLESLAPTYRLRMDVPGSSYAFQIGRRMHLPDQILERARELLGGVKVSLDDLIAEYEGRVIALSEREKELAQKIEQVESARADYEEKRRETAKRLARSRAESLEEGQRILQRANALIENTVREIRESQASRDAVQRARTRVERGREELEESLKAEKAKQERLEAESAPAPDRSAAIGVGDQVLLDAGNVTAEVLELHGDEAVISSGALHIRVDLNRLTRVGGRKEQQVHVRHASGTGVPATGVHHRIDIRGHRVDQALAAVGRLIDSALPTGLRRLEILHGKGTGALRKAIHDYLGDRAEVDRFEEADWEQGGAGVTIVHLS